LFLYGFDGWDPPEAGTFSNPCGIVNPNEPEDSPYRENDQRLTGNPMKTSAQQRQTEAPAFDRDCSGIIRSNCRASSNPYGFAAETSGLHSPDHNTLPSIEEFGL